MSPGPGRTSPRRDGGILPFGAQSAHRFGRPAKVTDVRTMTKRSVTQRSPRRYAPNA
jgi:hypothetical protein